MSNVSDRYYLVGDENGGVGVECQAHWDGGRPFIYYSRDYSPYPAEKVVHVKFLTDMLREIDKHEKKYHGEAESSVSDATAVDLARGLMHFILKSQEKEARDLVWEAYVWMRLPEETMEEIWEAYRRLVDGIAATIPENRGWLNLR